MEPFINKSEEVSADNKSQGASEESDVAHAFFVFALWVVFLFNVLGNSMVLYVVYHQWKNVKQRVTNSLIANLAGIDLLVAILVFLSIIKAIKGNSEPSYTKCQIDGFLSNLVGSCSITTMAVIAIDRYLVIVSKHGHRIKLKTARIIIACIWFTTVFFSLLPILFWGNYHHSERSTQCKPDDPSYLLTLAILFFIIPLVTMIFCYVSVFVKVRRHKQMIVRSLQQRNCSFLREFKTTKIVFTVLAVFVALWTPYVVVYMASTKTGSIPPGVFKVCGILTAMHSMCNPIIYFTMNKNFRRTAINLLRKVFSCVLPANEEEPTSYSVSYEKANCSTKAGTLRASMKTLDVKLSANELA